MLFTLLIVCLFAVSATGAAPSIETLLKKAASPGLTTFSVKPQEGYTLSWGVTTTRLFVGIEAETSGWIGFGLGEAAGMRGADFAIGHVDPTGAGHLGDYHARGNEKPVLDGCQDWTLHHAEKTNDGGASPLTVLVMSRDLVTQDSNDRPVLPSGALRRQSILIATGATGGADGSDYFYHGTTARQKFFLDLTAGTVVSQASWSALKAADPTLSSFEVRSNEGVAFSYEDGTVFRGPVPGGQLIPTAKTTYWDYCFPVDPAWNTTGKHVVAFETVGEGTSIVHHLAVSAFTHLDNCRGPAETLWVSSGFGNYDDLPDDVGIDMARFTSFMINVHYDNPSGFDGLRDNSGIRIWLTSQSPLHEAGIISIGDASLQLAGGNADFPAPVEIPLGRSFYTFSCSSEMTSAWVHDITVFGTLLHMHETGDAMYTEVIRNGTVVDRPNAVEYFDFNHQDPTLVQPFIIKRGDSLRTRCYYNNPGIEKPLVFGLGSENEMCIDFLYYYPRLESVGSCNPGQEWTFHGAENVTSASDPEGMRSFATNASAIHDMCPSTTPFVKSFAPTSSPTPTPTDTPTVIPTATPTASPSALPTSVPTAVPTASPTRPPTVGPTAVPTATLMTSPTTDPTTATPTVAPTRVKTTNLLRKGTPNVVDDEETFDDSVHVLGSAASSPHHTTTALRMKSSLLFGLPGLVTVMLAR